MTFILKTEGLNKVYRLGSFVRSRKIQALNDVNITVESDTPVVIAVVGESGSGKTTLARPCCGSKRRPLEGQLSMIDRLLAWGPSPRGRNF